jgi:two-component system sensor histidine kinase SenX3
LTLNLLHNAVKYSPADSEISVSIVSTEAGCDFQIRDQGHGIAAEEQDLIWERGYRSRHTKSSGTSGAGIGLAIVKELVAKAAGDVRLQSEPGQGAVFAVSLPR